MRARPRHAACRRLGVPASGKRLRWRGGSSQRDAGNRAKPLSAEHGMRPCSLASAARCASGTRRCEGVAHWPAPDKWQCTTLGHPSPGLSDPRGLNWSVRALVFVRFGVRSILIRTSHPSGSRRLCFMPMGLKHRPFRLWRTRNRSVPYRVQKICDKSYGSKPTPSGLTARANQNWKKCLPSHI